MAREAAANLVLVLLFPLLPARLELFLLALVLGQYLGLWPRREPGRFRIVLEAPLVVGS